jgi:hypothetical protein
MIVEAASVRKRWQMMRIDARLRTRDRVHPLHVGRVKVMGHERTHGH